MKIIILALFLAVAGHKGIFAQSVKIYSTASMPFSFIYYDYKHGEVSYNCTQYRVNPVFNLGLSGDLNRGFRLKTEFGTMRMNHKIDMEYDLSKAFTIGFKPIRDVSGFHDRYSIYLMFALEYQFRFEDNKYFNPALSGGMVALRDLKSKNVLVREFQGGLETNVFWSKMAYGMYGFQFSLTNDIKFENAGIYIDAAFRYVPKDLHNDYYFPNYRLFQIIPGIGLYYNF